MKTTSALSFALALALTGCGDNSNNDDDGNDRPDEPQLDILGNYRINSTFDIAASMPGTFLSGLIEATDDADDPAAWLVDQMLAQLPNGPIKTALNGAKPFVTGALNQQLSSLAPELVNTITKLGQRTEDMMKHFGVNEQLIVWTSDQSVVGTIVADGSRFEINGTTYDLAFADHDIDDVIVDSVLVRIENKSHMAIGDHALPLPYGKVVRMGFDFAVIPSIDASAKNLADLLDHNVNCHGVGSAIAGAINVGSTGFWESACTSGLHGAANQVYEQIAAKDSLLTFNRLGSARISDSNNDRKLDKLQFGQWGGTLTHEGKTSLIAQPATFFGARMY